ncbi:MAG: hypothetical protein DWQ34_28280 [Planctomycetota bacterium]|nr:MAG: hypothetical protein DWQ34_28280 [Planctomycetota bacterium]REJ90134.1 MAG: hypothetical protein DWQ29_06945 [Planctomycetota bacterium]REK30720.1 MAG: hypothetical protein DWQ41_01870 [Planctomycetota bacterium]REK33095.1 MAG: hypothetical protein DWQ45_15975 [Planctomycetota bacterium]
MRIKFTLAALSLFAVNFAAADDQPPVPVPDAPESSTHEVGPAPIALYPCVKVEDADNIHPCAVPIIVSVADPCNPCCGCRHVQICVPPDCCPKIKTNKDGTKVEYDYGEYEVDIKAKRDVVIVNYDD